MQFGALCPKPWHLKHCWIEGLVLNSSALKIMPVFWHINPPKMSALACFGSSHFILIKGTSLPDLLDVILSASAWVILLKSSSCLKSSIVTFVHCPLNTKISFCGICGVIWFRNWHLNVFPKTLLHFWFTLQDGEIFASVSYENPAIWDCLSWKTLRLGWHCLSSLMILHCVLYFGSIPLTISGVLFL